METLQVASGLLDGAGEKVGDGDIKGSMEGVTQADKVLKSLSDLNGAKGVELLARRARNVRDRVIGEVKTCWTTLVHVNSDEKKITIANKSRDVSLELDEVVKSMDVLGILSPAVSRFHRDFETLIISPRTMPGDGGSVSRITVSNTTIQASGKHDDANALDMIEDVYNITRFLDEVLPESISALLMDKVLPSLILQLVSGWLDPSMPLKLDHLETFKEIAIQVTKLADFIAEKGVDMPSDADLLHWLKRIPQNWLARRKESALADIRSRCYKAVKSKKLVEKIETQIVDSDDVMYGEQNADHHGDDKGEQDDDWGENWGDNEEIADEVKEKPTQEDPEDEVDSSAWDLEESEEPESKAEAHNDDGDEGDAWDEWGEEPETTIQPPSPIRPMKKPKVLPKSKPSKKEITLRETYAVTSVPDAMLDILTQILNDASTLKSPSFDIPTISAAAPGLSTIPTLLLALFRATASTYYTADPAGQMLIYNDTLHLATTLQTFTASIPPENPLASRIRLDADIEQLSHFGRRAYGKEMESQRTILSDILSSASGFVNCTAPLNAKQYAAIVQDAVNRVRDVDKIWNGILSNSARLQSLGSLVGTLTKQMIADILERADDTVGISDEQSKILKSYCEKIVKLADLFTEHGQGGEGHTLVHVYTPDWLRFIYLGEILEASLADIRYLWTEGELALEFEANEVIDLIQALFADSVHRRDAIREIRRPA